MRERWSTCRARPHRRRDRRERVARTRIAIGVGPVLANAPRFLRKGPPRGEDYGLTGWGVAGALAASRARASPGARPWRQTPPTRPRRARVGRVAGRQT